MDRCIIVDGYVSFMKKYQRIRWFRWLFTQPRIQLYNFQGIKLTQKCVQTIRLNSKSTQLISSR